MELKTSLQGCCTPDSICLNYCDPNSPLLWVSGDLHICLANGDQETYTEVDKYLLIESGSGNLRPLVGSMNVNRFMKED